MILFQMKLERIRYRRIPFVLGFLLATSFATSGKEIVSKQQRIQRFALIAGANYGGPDRQTLLYAHSDAHLFGDILEKIGGVRSSDKVMLKDPSVHNLNVAFDSFQKKIEEGSSNGVRKEAVFYYSGHADAKGLLLGNQRYSYQKLKERLDELPVNVHIAILDACASGAFTRLKGGQRLAPFTVDESSQTEGYAFITSSSADEASQESDALRGSYFTHNIVTGLRGAADASGDGKVTLGEAYQYAFHETLASTENTKGGAQHPSYDMKLAGTGDVVMTDVRQNSAGIILPKPVEGRMWIRNANNQLAAELFKPLGRTVELGLEPGKYQLKLQQGGTMYQWNFQLERGGWKKWNPAELQSLEPAETVSKGDVDLNDVSEYDTIPVSYEGYPQFSRKDGKLLEPITYHNRSINWLFGRYAVLEGFGIGLLGQWASERVDGYQWGILANYNGGLHRGSQFASVINISNNIHGSQFSGTVNLALDVTGLQVGGTNVAQDIKGVQVGFGISVGNNVTGVQVSSLGNVASRLDGVQVVGFINMVDYGEGVQASGVLNLGREIEGVQASGLLNVAGEVKGKQIGLVNIARNVEGETIGILNLNKSTQWHPQVWLDEAGVMNLSLKQGTGLAYGLLNVGTHVQEETIRPRLFTFGWGLGVRSRFSNMTFETDISENRLLDDKNRDFDWNHALYRLKMGVGFSPYKHFSVTAGGIFNLQLAGKSGLEYQNWIDTKTFDDNRVRLWPGFYAGVTF